MSRWVKEKAVQELARELGDIRQLAVIDYRGLKGSEAVELRRAIRKAGGRVRVVRNCVGRRALEAAGLGSMAGAIEGMSALVWSRDLMGPLKVLFDARGKGKKIKVQKGTLDGGLLGPEELEALSQMPGREELLAWLVGTLSAPAESFVRTLAEVPARFVRTLNAVAQRGPGGSQRISKPDSGGCDG